MKEEGKEDDPDAPGVKVNVVKVSLRAEIKQYGRRPEQVYSAFIRALTADVQDKPGVTIKAEALRKNRFDLVVYFAPASANIKTA